jgi:hypothetical protein
LFEDYFSRKKTKTDLSISLVHLQMSHPSFSTYCLHLQKYSS